MQVCVKHKLTLGRDPDLSSSQMKSNTFVNLVQVIHLDLPFGYVEGVVVVVSFVLVCVPKFPCYLCNPPQVCEFGSQLFKVEVLNVFPFMI